MHSNCKCIITYQCKIIIAETGVRGTCEHCVLFCSFFLYIYNHSKTWSLLKIVKNWYRKIDFRILKIIIFPTQINWGKHLASISDNISRKEITREHVCPDEKTPPICRKWKQHVKQHPDCALHNIQMLGTTGQIAHPVGHRPCFPALSVNGVGPQTWVQLVRWLLKDHLDFLPHQRETRQSSHTGSSHQLLQKSQFLS